LHLNSSFLGEDLQFVDGFCESQILGLDSFKLSLLKWVSLLKNNQKSFLKTLAIMLEKEYTCK